MLRRRTTIRHSVTVRVRPPNTLTARLSRRAPPAQPHVHLVAAEHHTHSTVHDHPIHASVVVLPVQTHSEHTHHSQPAAPAFPPAPSVPARTEPPRLLVAAGAAVKNRFSQQGKVSIVGTVVLSVLISAGLFSLQTISKWRRPKPTETVTKADSIDQPLTIASAQDESQTPNERADAPADSSPSIAANGSHTAQPASHSEDNDQRGLDDFFANGKKEVPSHAAVAQAGASRAPYAPEPVGLNPASNSSADTRTVMAPEAAGDHGVPSSEQPAAPLAGPPDALPAVPSSPVLSTAQNAAVEPGPQISPIYRPSSLPSPAPLARPLDAANGSPSSQQLVAGSNPGVNVADWNRSASPAAPGAPPSAGPVPAAPDAIHSRLDAPGPVIMPGRTPGSESTAANGPAPAVIPAAATAYPASQLADLSQQAPSNPSQALPGAIPPAADASLPGIDPVTGLVRRTAATPDVSQTEFSSALASLDRKKVMSFQFRNAPWTVVLSQFAAETHLELRMQVVPQGAFNRWDAARYSPSQTLAILNSEIARAGCQLKLEGNVLRVTSLSASTAQSTSARAAAASSLSALQQSSGIVPVSGRY